MLFSHATWLLSNDQIPAVQMGEVLLKGITKPVMTYSPDLSALFTPE